MKQESSIRGRDKFSKVKFFLNLLSKFYSMFSLKKRCKFFEKHRKTRGLFGIGLRYSLLKTIAKQCGDNVAIFPDAYILNPQNLSIGNNVSIHPMCYIECAGEVEIGDDVSIAHGTTIMSSSHTFSDLEIPIKDQEVLNDKVTVKNNVWIGAKSTILMGLNIEEGCVIGANSVVTKSTVPNCVYAGSPAKIIKER